MHRSGTSMLGGILEGLGLFTGIYQDEHTEALFFKNINKWLMRQCGARWDIPEATRYLWENRELMNLIEDYLRYLLDSPRSIYFLGFRRYMSEGGILGLDIPWGWKDPRNTFTLPIWLRIFPEAKVIYIERHGVDVAQSLLVRSQKGFYKTNQKYQLFKWVIPFFPKRGGFIESPRCATLEGGFSLWKEYTDQANEYIRELPEDRLLRLRYEEILENPIPIIRLTVEFCGLEVADSTIEIVGKEINKSRAYSFRNDEKLLNFALNHSYDLIERGYP